MKIWTKALGPIMTNCYILHQENSPNALVIDPGYDDSSVIKYLDKNRITDIQILLTHGHFDHTNGAQVLSDRFKAGVFLHPADVFLLDTPRDMAVSMGYMGKTPKIDFSLAEDQEISEGEFILRVIHTPGHSPGSVCFLGDAPEGPFVLSGDTLFQMSIGRTDLPGGNWRQILDSIITKLWPLPGDTRVLPGHGPETTIEFERRNNPFLNNV